MLLGWAHAPKKGHVGEYMQKMGYKPHRTRVDPAYNWVWSYGYQPLTYHIQVVDLDRSG